MATTQAVGMMPSERVVTGREERRVIIASSVGTVFEWYDFYTYAFTSIYFAGSFFPAGDATSQLLATAGIFAVGFFMRPLGGWLFGWLADNRKWIAGATLSLADFAAAAHLSALDFMGDLDWSLSPATKDWYARIKSRPSFRGLLADRVPGASPPAHYADLDF